MLNWLQQLVKHLFFSIFITMNEANKEPYQLSKCTVRIVITLFPKQDENSDRTCLIAVSTHEDFPVVQCASFSELQPLPKPIKEVLKKLKAELPDRKFNAEVKEFKTQKEPSPKSFTTAKEIEKKQQENKSNQTNLFD
jgi:hypothetical protein